MASLLLVRCAVALSYVFLLWYAHFLWLGLRGCDNFRTIVSDRWEKIRSMIWAGLTSKVEDPFESLVTKFANERRLERCASLRQAALPIMSLIVLWDTVCLTGEGIWGSIPEDRVIFYHDTRSFPPFVADVFSWLVFLALPSWKTNNVSDAMFALQGLRRILTIWNTTDTLSFIVNFSSRSFFRLTLSLACGSSSVTTPVNFVVMGAQCWGYYHCAMNDEKEIFLGHISHFIQREIIIFVIMTIFCMFMEHSLRAEIRATLQSNNSETVKNTFQGLLSVLCDVFVHLSRDLNISRPSQQLSAFLLSGRSGESFQGCALADLMNNNDKERFEGWIARSEQDSPGQAQALNVTFRSSGGIRLNAVLYSAKFEDVVGNSGYVVGISEVSAYLNELPDLVVEPLLDSQQHIDPNVSSKSGSKSKSRTSTSGSDSRTSSNTNSDEHGILTDTSVIRVTCDASEKRLLITDCDSYFTLLCGGCPQGACLSDWIIDPAMGVVSNWLSLNSRASALASEGFPVASEPLTLTFCTPLAKKVGITYRAQCRCSSLEQNLVTSFCFSNVQCLNPSDMQSFSWIAAVACSLSDSCLRIEQSSFGFTLLCGFHPEGENVLEWVLHPSDFLTLVQEQLAKQSSAQIEVVIQSALLKQLNVHVVSECSITRFDNSHLLKLKFMNLRLAPKDVLDDATPSMDRISLIRRRNILR